MLRYVAPYKPDIRPGVYYHATSREDAPSLLAKGADASLIGLNGGQVVGAGFYLCNIYYDAVIWANKLFNCPTTILQVALPKPPRIATGKEQQDQARELYLWGEAQGYVTLSTGEPEPTQKLYKAHHVTEEDFGSGSIRMLGTDYTLLGLLLREQGFDGYEVEDGIVLTNFALLSPTVFSIYS